MFSSPIEEFPNVYDFICAGVYFIKNGVRSKQFLQDWVSGPVDSSDEERAIMQEYAFNSAWSSGSSIWSCTLGTKTEFISIRTEILAPKTVL
jgi:hypothetical protein